VRAQTPLASGRFGGAWYSLYKGSYGALRIGAQGSYTRRNIFKGIGGSPSTDEGMFFTSLRYYPPDPGVDLPKLLHDNSLNSHWGEFRPIRPGWRTERLRFPHPPDATRMRIRLMGLGVCAMGKEMRSSCHAIQPAGCVGDPSGVNVDKYKDIERASG